MARLSADQKMFPDTFSVPGKDPAVQRSPAGAPRAPSHPLDSWRQRRCAGRQANTIGAVVRHASPALGSEIARAASSRLGSRGNGRTRAPQDRAAITPAASHGPERSFQPSDVPVRPERKRPARQSDRALLSHRARSASARRDPSRDIAAAGDQVTRAQRRPPTARAVRESPRSRWPRMRPRRRASRSTSRTTPDRTQRCPSARRPRPPCNCSGDM